ncbi:MAG: hypothetical protein KIT25_23510 [Enhydrobacter sp.]|nr:MAG: hypothetical protein KIT25_23510 [Enhydrobacter sp.]
MATESDAGDEPLLHRLVDSVAFLVRRHFVFWIIALPMASFAAALAYLLETHQQYAAYRGHWSWDLLFALIYAMFLDRWLKEALLDGAGDCDEVDNLRRSLIALPFLGVAASMFVLATALGLFRIEGIVDSLERWQVPHGLSLIVGSALSWLPHVAIWAFALSCFALMLPAMSAAETVGPRDARPGCVFRLILGLALASLLAYWMTRWGLDLLPKKPWAEAAMAGAWRLFDCLLLALGGHVLAMLWQRQSGWQQPEPEERPFRGLYRAPGRRARRA